MFKKITEVQKDLQAIANQKGAKGFEAAKAAYLESIVITDDAGSPLAPDAIQFDIQMPVVKAEESAVTKSVTEDSIRTAVRDELSKSNRSAEKSIRVEQPNHPLDSVAKRHFGRARYLKSNDVAYSLGQSVLAGRGSATAQAWCKQNGLKVYAAQKVGDEYVVKGQVEGTNTAGGFLVPEQFDTEIIDLRETYGVFRRNARFRPMTSDTSVRPRKTGRLGAYAIGEAVAITQSNRTWDNVRLTAKKWGILNKWSNEVGEDAIISMGDDFANDVAYEFSLTEDECGFLGDGTSTYHGIVGLTAAFDNLGTEANSAGVYSAAVAWSSISMTEIQAWFSLLPQYAEGPGCKIYCHKAFYHQVLERLAFTAGGTTTIDIKNGVPTRNFMGYDVEVVQVLPRTTATSQYDAFFGDLSKAADFGERRGITISTSDSALNAFEQDETAYRAVSRFDLNCHDVGNNHATAASRVAGPIVAWYRAS